MLFYVLAGVCTVPASAKDSEITRLQTSAARKSTIQALQAIDQGHWDLARQKIAETKDPLAAKIYSWLLYTEKKGDIWSPQLFISLTRFIRANPDWPNVAKMQLFAEDTMPQNLSNEAVVAWYRDYPPQTTQGMTRYMDAMLQQGDMAQAKRYLAEWWAETPVSRDQQKMLFQRYGNYLTLDAHKKRFDALLYKGNYDNARAIAGVLGHGYPELAEARIALAEQKPNASTVVSKVPSHLQRDAGLLYERLRWRRKHDLDFEAMEILNNAPAPESVRNPEDWWQERHILIRRLLEKHQYKSAYLLASQHMQKEGVPYAEAEWLAGWLALRYMNNPTEALQRFSAMYARVETSISKARAAYWSGRAAQQLVNMDLARDWYSKAAQFQTVFYGQLAGEAISVSNQLLNSKPPLLTKQDLGVFKGRELIQAAQLFHDAGQYDVAGRFLQAFIEDEKTPKAYRFAAELASQMGQYNDAIRIAKKAGQDGMFLTVQSYPTITKWLVNVDNVEWALVHSLIRQESMFDLGAVSSAGASGLMQLMPGTAKEVSGKLGIAYNHAWLTSKADYNIRLGSSYMERLLGRYNNFYPLAIAAYNAGPGRVDKWIEQFGDPRDKRVNLIDWIEMIPVAETRNYVQRVLENVYVYRMRLKGVQRQPDHEIHIASAQ